MESTEKEEGKRALFSSIESLVPLSSAEKEKLNQSFEFRSFQKGEAFIQTGQLALKIGFVTSGIFRVYKIRGGREITSYFNYKERNPFVSAFHSLLTGQASSEIVECIQEGSLLLIDYSTISDFYQTSLSINIIGRKLAEKNYLLALERIESLQNQSASERYSSFLILYPHLLNLIPHHYIASYLGVTPESLSRIRKSQS